MRPEELRLHSARLELRMAGVADVAEMFPVITPALTRYLSFDPPDSAATLATIAASWPLLAAAGTDLHMAVRARGSGEFLGMAGLHAMETKLPELGIWIKEAAQGQGYGLEAVRALADWASGALKPASFLYPVAERNRPSRQLAESLGGVVIGSREHRKYRALVYRIATRAGHAGPASPCL